MIRVVALEAQARAHDADRQQHHERSFRGSHAASRRSALSRLDPNEYSYEQSVKNGTYFLVMRSRRMENRAIAIYMEVRTDSSRGDSIITFGESSDTLLNLKLIKSNNPLPSFATWGLMWRNVYDLRQRSVDIDDLNVKVFKGLANRENTTSSLDYQVSDEGSQPYMEILGLDQYASLDSKVSDGKVDDRSEIWRTEWGLLIFPHQELVYDQPYL